MNTELWIESYKLDLTSDISALLTFSIDDVKDFASRSTTWSKTIVLPGTQRNNRIFGHIFQIGQENEYSNTLPNVLYNFNAAKSANIVLFQNQMQTFSGVLRLMQINYSNGLNGRVEYEVSIFGTLSGLNSKLTGALLEHLDFSQYDQTFSVNNIIQSWNQQGSGIFYPLIDYGNASTNKHDWDVKTFRPAFFVKEYIDKIFDATRQYKYICSLFGTPRFKSLIIPHNQKEVRVNQSVVGSGGMAEPNPTSFLFHDGNPDNPANTFFNAVPFNNFSSPIFSSAAWSGWGPTKFTYTDTPNVTLKIKYTVRGHYNSETGLRFSVNKNDGDSFGTGVIPSTVVDLPGTNIYNNTTENFEIIGEVDINFNQGDYFQMWGSITFGIFDVYLDYTSLEIVSATGSNLLVPVQLGQQIKCNDTLPKNIRQIDFLVWIVKLFNLYVYEDKNDPNLILIMPYIDFYSPNVSYAVDWTYKLDRSKPIKSKPMSELNAKIYKFRFKSDGDYYNDLYRKRYNEGYGDRVYDSEFEFSSQTQDLEIGFSSTPIVGYNGEDKFYSTIFKRTGNEPNVTEESIDSNIRILISKKIGSGSFLDPNGVSQWGIKNGSTTLTTLRNYGYAGHLDNPKKPTNDLNFGATKELFFTLNSGSLSENQFNVYWSGYMAEITNKNSKLITAYFKLDANDIVNLDFSKYIYVDGVAFRLNQIKDYNATKPGVCQVELLKVNWANYTDIINPPGPPTGCFLLWSDENILDWDDAEPLVYSNCEDNPGDGGGNPPPPTAETLSWDFSKGTLLGTSLKIYVNNILVVSKTVNSSGVLNVFSGDEVKVDVTGQLGKQKRIIVTNTVDGVVYDNSSIALTNSYTFTLGVNRNYNVNAVIT